MTIFALKLLYHCRCRQIFVREVIESLVNENLRPGKSVVFSIEQSRIAVAVARLLKYIRLADRAIWSLSLHRLQNLFEPNSKNFASHHLCNLLQIARRVRYGNRHLLAVNLRILDFVVFKKDALIPVIGFTPPENLSKGLHITEKLIF